MAKLKTKINAKIGEFLADKFKNMLLKKDEEKKEDEQEVKGEYVEGAASEDRPEFTFKSGGKYTGQWNGGFRDGQGVHVWKDGARYEG